MSQGRFTSLGNSQDKRDQIYNGQILHYTRRNPSNPELIEPTFQWFRSICPWDQKRSSNAHSNGNGKENFTKITRNAYNTQKLLEESRRVKRLIPNHPNFASTMETENKYAEESYNPGDKLSFSLQSGDRKNVRGPDENNNLNLDEFTDDRHAENILTREQSFGDIKDLFVKSNHGEAGDRVADHNPGHLKIQGASSPYSKYTGEDMLVTNIGILIKKSRYQSLTDTLQTENGNLTAEQVDKQLKEQGFNVDLLKQRDFVHKNVVEHMLNVLETSNIKYTAKAAERTTTDEFSSEEMRDFDCMIAAGGDGTFLKLASQIKSPDVPLVGMNTDGKGSKGALCCYTMNTTTSTFLKAILPSSSCSGTITTKTNKQKTLKDHLTSFCIWH